LRLSGSSREEKKPESDGDAFHDPQPVVIARLDRAIQ
jgi:hypothetical protein